MLIEKLQQRFGAEILGAENARGEETISIAREHAYDTFRALRDEPGFEFNFLTDLTAVDWLERKPRYDVVYHLNSLTLGHPLRKDYLYNKRQPIVPEIDPIVNPIRSSE